MKSIIREIHQKLVSRQNTCREIVLEKIALLRNNEYNSVNLLLEEYATDLADKVDEKIKNGKSIGLLEGIPFGINDTILLQGYVSSGSSDFLKNYTAPYTATVINKLIEAGAIPIVKENGDSFGHGNRSGSVVNVAKGNTVFSISNDSGGSIRKPDINDSVFSLKPTYGRCSRYGVMANVSSTDCVAPIASTLEDIRILINVMSGKDINDHTTYSTAPISDNIFETKKLNEKITIGYYKSFVENKHLETSIKEAFLKMIETISNQGFKVIPLDFFDPDILVSTYYVLAMAETASNLARLDGSVFGMRKRSVSGLDPNSSGSYIRSEYFSDETKRRIIGGNQLLSFEYDEDVYQKAKTIKNQIIESFNNDFEKVNIILSPVSTTLPPSFGQSSDNPFSSYFSDAFTVGFSLGGLPTLTAPLFTQTGVQITANKNQEDLILAFANHLKEIE